MTPGIADSFTSATYITGMEPWSGFPWAESAPPIATTVASEQTIDFYTSPWVSGTRCAMYGGPVTAFRKFTHPSEVGTMLDDLLAELARETVAKKCNAVVGLEVTIEMLDDGYKMGAMGTSACLEALF